MKENSNSLNAIRLHLILLREGSDAVRFKLIEFIRRQDRTAEKTRYVKYFLIEHKSNASPFLDGFKRTLREKFNNDLNRFPNDLNDFDITDCFAIAKHCLHLQGDALQPFDDLREMRNKYYGHLSLISIDDDEYRRVLIELKAIIQTLTQSDLDLQQELNIRINEIEAVQSLSHLNSTDWKNLNEVIIGLILSNKDMFQRMTQQNKEIEVASIELNSKLSIIEELLTFSQIAQRKSIESLRISFESRLDAIKQLINIEFANKQDQLNEKFEKTLKQEFNLIRKEINEQIISYGKTINEEEEDKNRRCFRNKWKSIFVNLHLLILFVSLVYNSVYSLSYTINHKGKVVVFSWTLT